LIHTSLHRSSAAADERCRLWRVILPATTRQTGRLHSRTSSGQENPEKQ
jgi:hypothetical protein